MVIFNFGRRCLLRLAVDHSSEFLLPIESVSFQGEGQNIVSVKMDPCDLALPIHNGRGLGSGIALGGGNGGLPADSAVPLGDLVVFVFCDTALGREAEQELVLQVLETGGVGSGDRDLGRHLVSVPQLACYLEGPRLQVRAGVGRVPSYLKVHLQAAVKGNMYRIRQDRRHSFGTGNRNRLYLRDLLGVLLCQAPLSRGNLLIAQSPVVDQDLTHGALKIVVVFSKPDPAGGGDILCLRRSSSSVVYQLLIHKNGIIQTILADSSAGENRTNILVPLIGGAVVLTGSAAKTENHLVLAGGKICAAPIGSLTKIQNAVVLAICSALGSPSIQFCRSIEQHSEFFLVIPEGIFPIHG